MVSVRMDLGAPDCMCLIERLDGVCPDCNALWRHGEIPGNGVDAEVVNRARAKILMFRQSRVVGRAYQGKPLTQWDIQAELSAAQARGCAEGGTKLLEQLAALPHGPEDYFGADEDTLSASLWYPNVGGPRFVKVELIDVRAADDIRIHYDFDRDGWVVEQPTIHEWKDDEDYELRGEGWKEVAFVTAWHPEKVAAKAGTD